MTRHDGSFFDHKSPLTIYLPVASIRPNPALWCTESIVVLIAANVDLIWAVHVSDAGVYIDISIVGVVVECASLPISSNLATIALIEGSRDGC